MQTNFYPFEWNGHIYPLRCNMSALERLQDNIGNDDLESLFRESAFSIAFELLYAMIEDAREEDPSLPEISMRQLKKNMTPAQVVRLGVLQMFSSAFDIGAIASDSPK